VPKNHWISKVAGKLECPLMTVTDKELKGIESEMGGS